MTDDRHPSPPLEPGARLSLTVESVAALGRAVARADGLTVLVARGVPGETVEAEVDQVHPRYALAHIVAVTAPALGRVEPACPHFADCGGCDWQHVAYSLQLDQKRQVLDEQLARIGGLVAPAGWTVRAAERTLAYRDRLEFSPAADGARWAPGFHPFQGTAPVPIAHCRLAPEVYTHLAQGALEALRGVLPPPSGETAHHLAVRRLAVHATENEDGAPGLALVLHLRDAEAMRRLRAQGPALVDALRGRWPELALLALVAPRSGRRGGSVVDTLLGPRWLFKRVNGLRYRLPVTGFFQVHPGQAERLTAHVVEAAVTLLAQQGEGAGEAPPVWDLFCGVGLFTLPLATGGRRVLGVEAEREAVRAARETAAAAGLTHCRFEAADLEHPRILAELRAEAGDPAVVIVDPPRRGLSAELCAALLEAAPPGLVYVSCDGGTFARDAARLATRYTLESLRGFDLFPQTHHLETVAVFRLRPG